jgi:hypothetical protein
MKNINLFWYSIYKFRKNPKILSKHFVRKLLGIEKENYGDLLSKYLVEKISKKKTKWYNPQEINPEKNYMAIGSILNYANEKSYIWGSGIIDRKHSVICDQVFAVRGPLTRARLLDLEINCPEIYGDPALLLPEYYNPKIKKKVKIGIVPHMVDYRRAQDKFLENSEIRIINLATSNIENTTRSILECEAIISSSLHGLIVAHAYNIPAVWVKFSNDLYGDDIKFYDYLASVKLKDYSPQMIDEITNTGQLERILGKVNNLPDVLYLSEIKKGLMKSCPF